MSKSVFGADFLRLPLAANTAGIRVFGYTKGGVTMRTKRLEPNDISKEFFEKFLEPFGDGYNPGKILNAFWRKYTLHEAMANLYVLLEKAKEHERDLPLFKAGYEGFTGEMASAITAYYFYFLRWFPTDVLSVPIGKTFHGEVYPGRKGFIDELNAIYAILSKTDSTTKTQQDEKASSSI